MEAHRRHADNVGRCAACGFPVSRRDRYCGHCGAPVSRHPPADRTDAASWSAWVWGVGVVACVALIFLATSGAHLSGGMGSSGDGPPAGMVRAPLVVIPTTAAPPSPTPSPTPRVIRRPETDPAPTAAALAMTTGAGSRPMATRIDSEPTPTPRVVTGKTPPAGDTQGSLPRAADATATATAHSKPDDRAAARATATASAESSQARAAPTQPVVEEPVAADAPADYVAPPVESAPAPQDYAPARSDDDVPAEPAPDAGSDNWTSSDQGRPITNAELADSIRSQVAEQAPSAPGRSSGRDDERWP